MKTTFLHLLLALLTLCSISTANAAGARDYYTTINPFYISGFGGQCTSYVWGRVYELHGIKLPLRGHAKTWWTGNSQFPTSSTPKSGSIAVWAGDSFNPYGHVGYVESVSGSTVYFTEANIATYNGTKYGGGYDGWQKNLTVTQMASRGKGVGKILGYILVGQQRQNRAPQVFSVSATSNAGSVTCSFSASDPDGDNLGYDVYLFTNSGYTGLRKTGSMSSSGTTKVTWTGTETASIPSGSQCYVRVDLFDTSQAKAQGWSPNFQFTKAATGTNTALDRYVSQNSSWLGFQTGRYEDSYYSYRYFSTGAAAAQSKSSNDIWYYWNGRWSYAGQW